MNDGEFTGLLAIRDLPFKDYADLDRVLEGLRKAGVPDLPFGFDPRSKDRLSGPEIGALILGHELQGHEIVSGKPYWRMTEADGSYRIRLGTASIQGVTSIEGDVMCNATTNASRSCLAIFRNPGGTFDRKNEYLLFRHPDRVEFSVIR